MKSKKQPSPKVNFEELIPLLLDLWRRMNHLPKGPIDKLQTREFRSLIEALLRFQNEKSFQETPLLGAYLLYDWILHYSQGMSLLNELPNPPKRVLDLGAKGAPFSFAALCHGAKEVVAIDTEERALLLGGEVSGKMGYPLTVRVHDCRNLAFPVDGKWDLIILGYSLFSFYEKKESQITYVNSLLSRLSENGHLLIVESSVKEENQKLLSLRNALVELGIPVQAPCLWKGECPALKSNSVCYAQRPFENPYLIKEIQRAADIHLSSLKMSYLILRPRSAGWAEHESKRLFRVVSPPVETFRGERYFLCGQEGRKTLGSRLKEHPKSSRAYEYLQRGDVVSIDNPLEGKDDMEITEETTFALEAPAGKPVVEIKPELSNSF